MNFYSSIEGNHAAAVWVQMAKNLYYEFSGDDDEEEQDDENWETYMSAKFCSYSFAKMVSTTQEMWDGSTPFVNLTLSKRFI